MLEKLKTHSPNELTKKLNVTAHRFSTAAKDKIEKAGGSVVALEAAAAAA